MSVTKAILPALAGIVLSTTHSAACEPCRESLTLEQTIARAELVVNAERMDFRDGEVSEGRRGGPSSIRIYVHASLKGNASPGDTLNVRSWDGMCMHGVYLGKSERAILYLVRRGTAYEPVALGCGVGMTPVTAGRVELDGESISLDRFRARYFPVAP